MRKIMMQANRNGYFYVLDRETGELLKANQFVDKVTWADGIDMKTGRPIVAERVKNMLKNGRTHRNMASCIWWKESCTHGV